MAERKLCKLVLALSDVQSGFFFWFITMGAGRACMHQHGFVYLHAYNHEQTAASTCIMGAYNRCVGFVLAICMGIATSLLYLL